MSSTVRVGGERDARRILETLMRPDHDERLLHLAPREAAFLSLVAKALKGDMRAMDILLKLIQREAEFAAPEEKINRIKQVIVDPKMTDDEWERSYGDGKASVVSREALGRRATIQLKKFIKAHGRDIKFTDAPCTSI